MKDGSNIFKIVKMIMERNFAPVIVFSFSKKECEAYALQMAKLDFNTNEEKKLVDEVFNNAMMVLSKEDRTLPQVENVLPLLKRGIGIHHGGLLPILKAVFSVIRLGPHVLAARLDPDQHWEGGSGARSNECDKKSFTIIFVLLSKQ
jgi:hypothetical protein